MKIQLNTIVLSLVLAGCILASLGSQSTYAFQPTTPITVNSILDPGDGLCDAVECTLHEALTLTNATPGLDLINFNLSPGTIALNQPLPMITDSVTFNGNNISGNGRVTVSGNNQFRIFDVAAGVIVHLQQLTVADGVVHRGSMEMEPERGGGIRNAGTLYIEETTLQDNTADEGGGIYNTGLLIIKNHSTFLRNRADDGAEGGNGGAIYNAHKVSFSDSLVGGTVEEDRNTAVGLGGGLYNAPGSFATILKGTVFAYNRAWRGGAILNSAEGKVTVANSSFNNNGGVWSAGQESAGAIWNQSGGTLNIENGSFSGNSAHYRGGSILNEGVLTINNSTFQRELALDWGGSIYNIGTASIQGCTFDGNESWNYAGVIANGGPMSIINSTFSHSYSWDGSVILNGGDLNISGSTFSENYSDYNGAISNGGDLEVTNSTFHHNQSENGAAILNQYHGEAVISQSVFSENSAYDFGGAIANWDQATLWVTNSTFAGNVAEGYSGQNGQGGAIYNAAFASVAYSTISENTAEIGGGLFNLNSSHQQGTLQLTGTIIANNEATIEGSDCAGSVVSMDYNLDSDGTCGLDGLGDLTADPLLGPLQFNGGSTETMALMPGSPAIDHIPEAVCAAETDQRGITRPQNLACDMGAFEVE